jgi:hypothetical protein
MESIVKWNDASVLPPVKHGDDGYYLVAIKSGGRAFGAYYMNERKLQYEDCPTATKENNWATCESCENGDGHSVTGWFDERGEEDESKFFELYAQPIVWAECPVFEVLK